MVCPLACQCRTSAPVLARLRRKPPETAKKPTRRAVPRETLSLLYRPFQKRESLYRRGWRFLGRPARLPCRTAPRTPVPAIPPADGPLACQCRTSTPVPAIPLVPASPSTYRTRAGPLARVVARAPTPVPAHNTIARKHFTISTGSRARNWRAPARNSLHFRYQILFTLFENGERQEAKKRAKVKVY